MNFPFQNKNKVGLSNAITREKWLEKTLKALPAGKRILDAGAGELQFKKFCTHLDYVSQDFGKYESTISNVGLKPENWDNSKLDIVSDIINIPVENNSFDIIMCTEVFEHLPAPILAIKEFTRILKPGGTLIITAPFCSLTHFAPYFFYTGFSKYFYEKHLVDHGFQIKEMTPNGNYFEYVAQELRRIPDVALKYTDRKLGFFEKRRINKLLPLLEKLSNADSSSSELLHFDFQVVAVKN
ncbi:MAG: methyltransferase domain-containing protein [Bacteroidia bacterium]|nr:methyltransferase domain-containing protein [Bacteroidia bacterium]